MASAKVFAGKPEQTEANLAILAKHVSDGVLASVKYDGWRMFEYNGGVLCRSMKPPKNRHTQKVLAEVFAAAAGYGFKGLDAENVVGDEYHPNCMQNCSSAFNTYEGEPEFTFNVFDCYQFSDTPFEERLGRAAEAVAKLEGNFPFVKLVEHKLITNFDELMAFLDAEVAKGGEGIMGRSRGGKYKFGRSTMKEGWLWALKPYVDDEAQIIGFEEELENQNEQTTNERGYSQRSGHKENLVPKGRLGRFICLSSKFGETFSVGAGVGLTHELRQQVWDNREAYLYKFLKYKYQAVGIKDRPRQPKFMGFRDPIDMARK
jgi:DNA ligase-1